MYYMANIYHVNTDNNKVNKGENSMNFACFFLRFMQPGISVGSQNVSRTGISGKQTEQLYEKMGVAKRQMLFELFQELSVGSLAPHIASSKPAVPPQWYIQTLDNWRYVPFEWPHIHFQTLPEVKEQEALFSNCMKVLEVLSLPICYLVCRYETLRKSGGQVVSIAVPIRLLSEFIRVHKMDGAQHGDAFHALRALWKKEGISEEMFRQMALIVFKFRQHGGVSFLLLHSSIDQHSLWICFRDYPFIINDLWLKGLLRITESDNERVDPNTPPKTCCFVDWPIVEHSAELDVPQYLCQYRKCLKGNDLMVHESIRAQWKSHKGPREKRSAAFVKNRMGKIWHEKYEPMVVKERDVLLEEQGCTGDKEKEKEIQNRLLDKYEAQAVEDEKHLEEEWTQINCCSKMKRCSGCKQVYYCSAKCQQSDWSVHKLICKTFTK